jgi:hypothetical protein
VQTLKPGNVINVAVLDFFLSWESHHSRTSSDSSRWFYYLSRDVVRKLTGNFEDDRTLLRQWLVITTDHIIFAPFLFLVEHGPTAYFLVMFDFVHGKGVVFGRRGRSGADFSKAFAEWNSWNGHMLWNRIYNALISPETEEMEREPAIYESDLILVLTPLSLLCNSNLLLGLARFSLWPWYFGLFSSSPGRSMELGSLYILCAHASDAVRA